MPLSGVDTNIEIGRVSLDERCEKTSVTAGSVSNLLPNLSPGSEAHSGFGRHGRTRSSSVV
jgi:hypothetical protein